MKFRNQFLKYMAPQEGDGGEGAAPTGEEQKQQEQQVDVKALQDELERLRAHHDKLLNETKAAKAERQRQEEAARQAAEEAARKAGDVEALEKSWQGKYSKLESEAKERTEKLQAQINAMLIDGVASTMALELAVEPEVSDLLAEQIKKSLGVTERDGKLTTAVLEDGKPSAMTLDELKKAVQANPKFARLVKGSPASGAGAGDTKPSGGAGGANQAAEAAKKSKDLAGFLSASLNI